MNWDQVQGQWKQLKGAARQKWGRLTDNDLEFIAGKKDELVGKIQERYGISKEEAMNQVEAWDLPSGSAREEERPRKAS